MIQSLAAFIQYYGSICRRTITYIQAILADRLNCTPQAGEFTFADLIRPIAAGERMFVDAVPWQPYRTCRRANTLPNHRQRLTAVEA